MQGTCLTAKELLFGLMLPSGNDAGFMLARHFGNQLEAKGEALEA